MILVSVDHDSDNERNSSSNNSLFLIIFGGSILGCQRGTH
jgi:hypothetical protein